MNMSAQCTGFVSRGYIQVEVAMSRDGGVLVDLDRGAPILGFDTSGAK